MNLPRLARLLLWPLSVVYGAYMRVRLSLYTRGLLKQKRLRGIVISVGNLTVGGTGKTPMVLWLAEKFLAEGKRVAILSRGYRGSGGTSDEIELMKSRLQNRAAFGVGKDRFEEGRRIELQQPVDIFLLDDGFQHLQLARDLDIVLVDRLQPVHSERLLPIGRLREPQSALNRAGLVVFTRVDGAKPVVRAIQRMAKFPIFPASTRLIGFRPLSGNTATGMPAEVAAAPCFAFCGIGNPQAFVADLERWRLRIVGRHFFRDHHRYSAADTARLEELAARSGAKVLVTTEKDAQNLERVRFSRMPVYVCLIALHMPDEKQFLSEIQSKLKTSRGAAA